MARYENNNNNHSNNDDDTAAPTVAAEHVESEASGDAERRADEPEGRRVVEVQAQEHLDDLEVGGHEGEGCDVVRSGGAAVDVNQDHEREGRKDAVGDEHR